MLVEHWLQQPGFQLKRSSSSQKMTLFQFYSLTQHPKFPKLSVMPITLHPLTEELHLGGSDGTTAVVKPTLFSDFSTTLRISYLRDKDSKLLCI